MQWMDIYLIFIAFIMEVSNKSEIIFEVYPGSIDPQINFSIVDLVFPCFSTPIGVIIFNIYKKKFSLLYVILTLQEFFSFKSKLFYKKWRIIHIKMKKINIKKWKNYPYKNEKGCITCWSIFNSDFTNLKRPRFHILKVTIKYLKKKFKMKLRS